MCPLLYIAKLYNAHPTYLRSELRKHLVRGGDRDLRWVRLDGDGLDGHTVRDERVALRLASVAPLDRGNEI
jgi:hypothetical protein